jgi:hypothetical protein
MLFKHAEWFSKYKGSKIKRALWSHTIHWAGHIPTQPDDLNYWMDDSRPYCSFKLSDADLKAKDWIAMVEFK